MFSARPYPPACSFSARELLPHGANAQTAQSHCRASAPPHPFPRSSALQKWPCTRRCSQLRPCPEPITDAENLSTGSDHPGCIRPALRQLQSRSHAKFSVAVGFAETIRALVDARPLWSGGRRDWKVFRSLGRIKRKGFDRCSRPQRKIAVGTGFPVRVDSQGSGGSPRCRWGDGTVMLAASP